MFEGSEILYQDEIKGSLILIADRIIDFIFIKYLKAKISYHKDTRVETYPFARDAVREAVYNALIHCDWSANVPIQIRVERDMMRIGNCCVLPLGWDTKKLMGQHNSVPFNPKIAGVFFRAGYIESWGRGIEKICDACKTLGTEKPEYIISGSDIMVVFKALQNAIVDDFKLPNGSLDGSLDGSLENKLILLLKQNPKIKIADVANELDIGERSCYRLFEKLKAKGKIERIGGKRYGYWKVYE